MPNTLVQFRIDDTLRQQANDLCTKLGFDLPTYLRMSLTRLVQEQGVPFAIKLNSAPTAMMQLPPCKSCLQFHAQTAIQK